MTNEILWEEKNLIEPAMKSESNGVLVENDIMKDIKISSNLKSGKSIKKKRNRNPEYLKRKYKKKKERHKYRLKNDDDYRNRHNIKLKLKKNNCKTLEEYKIKKELQKLESIKKEKESKKLYKQIHYFINLAHKQRERCRVGHKITARELWKIAKRQRLICPLTGRKLNRDNISIDHIIPLSQGGGNNPENLRFIHIDANVFKKEMNDATLLQLAKDIVNNLELKEHKESA